MKRTNLSLNQDGNKLFRRVFLLSVATILLMITNSLQCQEEMTLPQMNINDTSQNEMSEVQDVVINHALIENFKKVNFPANYRGFRSLISTYTLDSMKVAFETYMQDNSDQVFGAKTNCKDDSLLVKDFNKPDESVILYTSQKD